MTIGSLFDGIGGFPLAGQHNGITAVWASEIEPLPIAVTRKHFPNTTHLGNIGHIKGYKIPLVDVISGGSPCQDLSIAGKRAGLDGKRSGLFFHQIRIVKEQREYDRSTGRTGKFIRPRFLVWENVYGALSSNKGEDFRTVLEEICRIADNTVSIPQPKKWLNAGCILGDGYSVAWRVVDAQYWRVPQRRRRVYLITDFGGQTAPEILFNPESVPGDFEPCFAPEQGAACNAETGAFVPDRALQGDRSGSPETASEICLTPWDTQSARIYSVTGVWHSLNANENGGQSRDAVLVPTAPCVVFENHPTYPSNVVCAGFSAGNGSKAGSVGYSVELTPTLKASPSGLNQAPCVAFENHAQDSRVTGPLDVCPTISRKFGTGGNNTPLVMSTGQSKAEILSDQCPTLNCNHEQPIIAGIDCRNGCENEELCATLQAKPSGGQSLNCIHPVRIGFTIRRLTPLECERLQAYPDNWTVLDKLTDMTDDDYIFWRNVYVQAKEINGKPVKKLPTKPQIIRWYNKLGSDSARYCALGNSVAVVNPDYIMRGIARVLNNRPFRAMEV